MKDATAIKELGCNVGISAVEGRFTRLFFVLSIMSEIGVPMPPTFITSVVRKRVLAGGNNMLDVSDESSHLLLSNNNLCSPDTESGAHVLNACGTIVAKEGLVTRKGEKCETN